MLLRKIVASNKAIVAASMYHCIENNITKECVVIVYCRKILFFFYILSGSWDKGIKDIHNQYNDKPSIRMANNYSKTYISEEKKLTKTIKCKVMYTCKKN